tara:strand:- start:249 stop:674 length:426 start_codon:yes stop_codon:yes gene_type:complete
MKSIVKIQEDILAELDMFDDWIEKYEYLISLGKELPKINEKYKTKEHLIKGCQSKVWLHSEYKNGGMIYVADSDAIMTKGIVALLIRLLSHQKPANIINTKVDAFISKIGLSDHLSITRANGLFAMIKEMKLRALLCTKEL